MRGNHGGLMREDSEEIMSLHSLCLFSDCYSLVCESVCMFPGCCFEFGVITVSQVSSVFIDTENGKGSVELDISPLRNKSRYETDKEEQHQDNQKMECKYIISRPYTVPRFKYDGIHFGKLCLFEHSIKVITKSSLVNEG